MSCVVAENLSRTYGTGKGRRKGRTETTALDGVSLRIDEGELHGLLGPNGAGKTTLVKILSTVLLPTAGSASVLGHDVVEDAASVRAKIGMVFGGDLGLYKRLSARQNLRYWAALYRLPDQVGEARTGELLERMGLAGRADERVETFSRGMNQRLHLARGLISDPPVLFLDEPTIGLDAVAARELRAMVRELHGEGRTILLTTHDMTEAEALCDRVTLIDRGEIVATETPRALATWISRFERIDVNGASTDLLDALRALPGVSSVDTTAEGSTRIEVTREDTTPIVLARLVEAGVTSIQTSLPSLEEVYVHVVGDRGLQV